jgi:hypothetical protein
MRRHSSGASAQACGGWLFRESLESQKKDNTPLLHLVYSHDLKYADIFGRFLVVFSTFSFKDLLFAFLSLTVKIQLIE